MHHKHRRLTEEERSLFKDLFRHNTANNFMMKRVFSSKAYALFYPMSILSLFTLSLVYHKGMIHTILAFILGIMSIQLNFIVSHMWAHALMLEYDKWTIRKMIEYAGHIPSVTFFAFYHHHSTPEDNWMSDTFTGKDLPASTMTAVAHWNSFSLSTMHYPGNVYMVKYLALACLCMFPSEMSVYFLAYEIGVFLLPISHDWVHKRNSIEFATKYGLGYPLYYLLNMLNIIGLFATKEDHERHHNHSHPTVYQGFTSSGLYSRSLDNLFDTIWNLAYDYEVRWNVPMCMSLKWHLLFTIWFTFFASLIILVHVV